MESEGDDLWKQAVGLKWLGEEDVSLETKQRAIVLLANATYYYRHYNSFHDLLELCTDVAFSLPDELEAVSRIFVESIRGYFSLHMVGDDADARFKQALANAAAKGHLYAGYCAEAYFGGDWSAYREHGVPDAFCLLPCEDRPCATSLLILEKGAALGNTMCKRQANDWKLHFPSSVCPWGCWTHSRPTTFLPDPVRMAIYTWLLVCQRMRREGYHFPKEMGLVICDWIVTASGWADLVFDKEVSDEEDEVTAANFVPLN